MAKARIEIVAKARIEIYPDGSKPYKPGSLRIESYYRWRCFADNGQPIAVSPRKYANRRNAHRAAKAASDVMRMISFFHAKRIINHES